MMIDLWIAAVRSRCALIRFAGVEHGLLAHALEQRFGVERDRARLAASLSDGSFTAAIEMLEGGTLELREAVVKLFLELGRDNVIASADALYGLVCGRRKFPGPEGRRRAVEALGMALSFYRDVLSYSR